VCATQQGILSPSSLFFSYLLLFFIVLAIYPAFHSSFYQSLICVSLSLFPTFLFCISLPSSSHFILSIVDLCFLISFFRSLHFCISLPSVTHAVAFCPAFLPVIPTMFPSLPRFSLALFLFVVVFFFFFFFVSLLFSGREQRRDNENEQRTSRGPSSDSRQEEKEEGEEGEDEDENYEEEVVRRRQCCLRWWTCDPTESLSDISLSPTSLPFLTRYIVYI
jgi:hypothetical protein